MSLSDNYSPDVSTGNGATVLFTGTWSPLNEDYMLVYLELISTGVQTLKILDTDYTLTFDSSGYTVDFTISAAPSALYRVIRARTVALDQTAPFTTAKGFQGQVQENAFDKITAICQDIRDAISRSLTFALGSSSTATLPEPEANKVLGWNGAGTDLENKVSTDTATPYIGTLLLAATAAAARSILGAVGLSGNETIAGIKTFSGTLIAALMNSSAISNCTLDNTVIGGIIPLAGTFTTISEITGAAWTAYTPTLSANSGTLTSASATGRYRKLGKTCFFEITATITTNGTAAGALNATLPFTVSAFGFNSCGRESTTGKMVHGNILASQAVVSMDYYDNSYPAVNGSIITLTGVYETV